MSAFTSGKKSNRPEKKKPGDDLESVLESAEISTSNHRHERSRTRRHGRALRRTCKFMHIHSCTYLYMTAKRLY